MRHTFWRPLADLTDEEMGTLDKVTKKLTASPNALQNQIKSKPAIEAEAVDSVTLPGSA